MPRVASRSSTGIAAWAASTIDVVGILGLYGAGSLSRRMDGVLAGCWMTGQRLRPGRVDGVRQRMRTALGEDPSGAGWEVAASAYLRMRIETHLQRVREAHRIPPPMDIRIEGLDHLETALAGGRGALLWRMQFCSSHIAKRALWENDIPLVHVSNWFHGSRYPTTLGLRVFAPIYIRSETRYLKQRLVIPADESLDYLRQALEHLRDNDVVSIFGELDGRAALRLGMLGRHVPIATGTPSLARRTGAPMLTSYTVRLSPTRYRVVIEPPISVERGANRKQYIEAAVAEFGGRLERAVRRHPESWNLWETD